MSFTPDISLPLDQQPLPAALPSPELAKLISDCMANDRSAHQRLYKTYYGKMMAMCMRYMRNRDDALEVLNMGFLKVYKSLGAYQSNGSFDGWVYRIIYNTVIDRLRSKVKEVKTVEIDRDMIHCTIDSSSIQELYVSDLMKLMDALPESTRVVFNMFAIEGYPHSEIGRLLGISEGTSKWHVSHARGILKQQIENNYSKS